MIHFVKVITRITFTLVLGSTLLMVQAQTTPKPAVNWQASDLKADGIFGISLTKAYAELLKDKKAEKVIVAVIDGGVDTDHEDLKAVIWTNPKEKPGNKKDDDKNGYVDDVQGWNFMGSSKGSFHHDNMDMVRQLRAELKKDPNSEKSKALQQELDAKNKSFADYIKVLEGQKATMTTIISKIGKANPSIDDFRTYRYQNEAEAKMLVQIVKGLKEDPKWFEAFDENYRKYRIDYDYKLNIDFNPRADKEFSKPFYGNPDSKGLDPYHGTHVAGIIAAVRGNGIGLDGISDKVLIMSLRAVPDGDALELDVANAIRYAADNGAKVINISAAKNTTLNQVVLDEAVKYAMQKDVLIVRAAGNEGEKVETEKGFPTRHYLDGGVAEGWIEVGANNPKDDKDLVAWFSNHGAKVVDVFAPGTEIYSTIPGNKYAYESGSSMAAPVVSGLAAMLRAYYPKLTALQVKDIIMKSVVKRDVLKDKCISGGVVNAYEAFRLAESYK